MWIPIPLIKRSQGKNYMIRAISSIAFFFTSKPRSRFFTIPVISCFFFTLLIVQGCKTTSRLPASGQTTSNSTKVLMDSMQRHAFYFEWVTGKAKVEVYEGTNKTEFTASIRMRKDSAIWLSVSPALGLEVARVLITRDSIRVIDRLNGFGNFDLYTV